MSVFTDTPEKVSVTYKLGGDAPWIVVHAGSVEEASAIDGLIAGLAEQVSATATLAKAVYAATSGGLTAVPAQSPPQAPFAPSGPPPGFPAPPQGYPEPPQAPPYITPVPGVPVPTCNHGQRRVVNSHYKSGARIGQPYTAYHCPLDRNDPNKCESIWS